jgi:hypothetical protein
MQKTNNPFDGSYGSDRTHTPVSIILLLALLGLSAWLTSKMNLKLSAVMFVLPLFFIYLFLLFRKPVLGLYTAIVWCFCLNGLGRYVGDIPLGLAMDGVLLVTYASVVFNKLLYQQDWSPIKKDVALLALIWFGYSLLQLFNPEIRSFQAWMGGMRGVSLYMFLIIPLTLLYIDNQRKLNIIFYIWGVFSLLASLKGIAQEIWGVDHWEKAWLDQGGAITHVIFGKLRVFSFLSDAGQFGANQAYSAVMAIIVLFTMKEWHKKVFFLLVAILGIVGLLLSGTRGAISIPFAGFTLFFILRKNWPIMISGFLMILVLFVFFKYTWIGQDNQYIRRMRTAFDLNDASLQVRLENQQRLSVYLADKPFGGGIGHAGVKAQRYLPNAYLSSIPTDSWYVLIWAEQGIVGLFLHLAILFYILIKGSYLIMFRIRDPELKMKMAALASGMFGVMVASYGNAVLGTMPTSIILYTSMALLLNAEKLDRSQPVKLSEAV